MQVTVENSGAPGHLHGLRLAQAPPRLLSGSECFVAMSQSISASFKVLVSHTATLKSKHTVEQKAKLFPKDQLGTDVD